MKKRILVIGDRQGACQFIQENMQNGLTDVCYVMSEIEALDIFTKSDCCLAIINIELSRISDLEILRTFREAKPVPIIVLTTKPTPADRIALFQAGANAYWEKPLNLDVCVAQANSLIQLYLEQTESRIYRPLIFGTELIIDPTYRQVIISGTPLALTRKEFDLLLCLARHPGQVWSRTQLYSHVWSDDLGLSGENAVKVHIGHLRKKLANMGKKYIQTSWGVGYKFVPPIESKKEGQSD